MESVSVQRGESASLEPPIVYISTRHLLLNQVVRIAIIALAVAAFVGGLRESSSLDIRGSIDGIAFLGLGISDDGWTPVLINPAIWLVLLPQALLPGITLVSMLWHPRKAHRRLVEWEAMTAVLALTGYLFFIMLGFVGCFDEVSDCKPVNFFEAWDSSAIIGSFALAVIFHVISIRWIERVGSVPLLRSRWAPRMASGLPQIRRSTLLVMLALGLYAPWAMVESCGSWDMVRGATAIYFASGVIGGGIAAALLLVLISAMVFLLVMPTARRWFVARRAENIASLVTPVGMAYLVGYLGLVDDLKPLWGVWYTLGVTVLAGVWFRWELGWLQRRGPPIIVVKSEP